VGDLTSYTDATGTTTYAYNAVGNLTRVTDPAGHFLAITYNTQGLRSSTTDDSGFVTDYSYDAAGRLTGLTDGAGNPIVTYTYNAANLVAAKSMANGTSTTYGYDANGNVTAIMNLGAGGAVNSEFLYTYDALGRRTSETTLAGTTTYSYDGASELTGIGLPGGQTITYAYDPRGNRVSVTTGGVTTPYTVSAVNEYSTIGSAGYTYDADGDLIKKTDGGQTWTYTYNALDQMTAAVTPKGTFTYTYDPFGNLVAESNNGVTTSYLVDPSGAGDVVAQYNGSGQLEAHYTQGLGLTSRVDSSGAADFYDFDGVGSTAGLTGSDGLYLAQYGSLPFGDSPTATGSIDNPFIYGGQAGAINDGSGLVLMRHRTYDPATGQFTTNDPIGLAGGDPNLRRYAANNPVSLIDPLGTGYFYGNGLLTTELGQAAFDNNIPYVPGHSYYRTDDGQTIATGLFGPGNIPGPDGYSAGETSYKIIDPKHYDDSKIIPLFKQRLPTYHPFQKPFLIIYPNYTLLANPSLSSPLDNCESLLQKVRTEYDDGVHDERDDHQPRRHAIAGRRVGRRRPRQRRGDLDARGGRPGDGAAPGQHLRRRSPDR
jgi:RHS repeat-associated protein